MSLQGRQIRPVVRNQWILKSYGSILRLVHLNQCFESGWECSEKQKHIEHSGKLAESISRSRRVVWELAQCNEWDWFFTGTISPDKFDRSNWSGFRKVFTQWIRNERKRGSNIEYVLVPELHADLDNWHVHGLIRGIFSEDLKLFKDSRYNWTRYEKKFGFCSLEPIRNHEAVSKYITKYISKSFEVGRGVREKEKNMYICSQGLKRAEVIKKGHIKEEALSAHLVVKNEYCEVYEFDSTYLEHLLTLYTECE